MIYGALLTAAAAGAIRGLLSTSSASIAAFRKGKDPPKKFIQSKKESPSGPPGRRPRRDFQQKSKKNRYPTIVLQKWKHFESFVIFINVLKKKKLDIVFVDIEKYQIFGFRFSASDQKDQTPQKLIAQMA